jgi:hypothetical protein
MVCRTVLPIQLRLELHRSPASLTWQLDKSNPYIYPTGVLYTGVKKAKNPGQLREV